MTYSLAEGVPLERDYRDLINSDDFRTMEEFSDSFLSANKIFLREYTKKWVIDPLHQWSRQWEYPFVFGRVQQKIQNMAKPKILDAGSGVSFFPYYLKAKFESASIYCCDYDKKLVTVFEQINANSKNAVEFLTADLRDLPYENEAFHMVYCISVLEHTADYERIIQEFYRILQPGGTIVVTIDISLDGTRDIDVKKGTILLSSLNELFEKEEDLSLNLHSHVSKPGILTTLTAKDLDANLLPWKLPSVLYRIRSFFASGRFGHWPPLLTVFCICLTKRST